MKTLSEICYEEQLILDIRSGMVMRREMRRIGRPERVVYYTKQARTALILLRQWRRMRKTSMSIQAIESAGYRVVSAEPGQPIVVTGTKVAILDIERPAITGADLAAAMEEGDHGLNHIVRSIPKKHSKIQPWREKSEQARLARLKARKS